jgi:hypothetical protein
MSAAHAATSTSTPIDRRCCAGCVHFCDQPAQLEARLPGLASLSSAYASVRAHDGICERHSRYVAASSVCAHHRGFDRPPAINLEGAK